MDLPTSIVRGSFLLFVFCVFFQHFNTTLSGAVDNLKYNFVCGLGGVFKYFVICTPIPGEMIQFDGPHIFQMG